MMYDELANLAINPNVSEDVKTRTIDILGRVLQESRDVIFEKADSNDDVLWWSLAFDKAYKLTSNEEYLALAQLTFDHVLRDIDGNLCGGGVLWDHKKTYKNSITNELLLDVSTKLYETTGDSKYLDIAITSWAWFESSGLLDGLVSDGLKDSPDCGVNLQGCPWTYNQGVLLSGLGRLRKFTGNNTLLVVADNLINVVIGGKNCLTDAEHILKEGNCEDGTSDSCNHDQKIFKGIFARHVGYYLLTLTTDERLERKEQGEFLRNNAASVWRQNVTDVHANVIFGHQWDTYVETTGGDGCAPMVSALALFNAVLSMDID